MGKRGRREGRKGGEEGVGGEGGGGRREGGGEEGEKIPACLTGSCAGIVTICYPSGIPLS